MAVGLRIKVFLEVHCLQITLLRHLAVSHVPGPVTSLCPQCFAQNIVVDRILASNNYLILTRCACWVKMKVGVPNVRIISLLSQRIILAFFSITIFLAADSKEK